MIFEPGNIDLRRLGRNAQRSSGFTAPDRLIVSQQPDDRPQLPPGESAKNWVEAPGKPVYTDRRKTRTGLSYSDKIVAAHDEGRVKPVMARSSEIRPPVLRDYDTPGRGKGQPKYNPGPSPAHTPTAFRSTVVVD